jgi:hypothetical protein
MSLTSERMAALTAFAQAQLGTLDGPPSPASSDASFRSYWRVYAKARPAIVMDAPPGKEDTGPFVDVCRRLIDAGVRAPAIAAADPAQGFLLLEDFGTRTLLPALSEQSVDAHYAAAFDALQSMLRTRTAGLPVYDSERLIAEMSLFETWFLRRHLGLELSCDDTDQIEACMTRLVQSALEQPRYFVHRDYHSRNLMLLDNGALGVIDFQDAVQGPITYDLVSLLKDCYVQWPLARVYAWADQFREQLTAAGLISVGPTRWRRWFDWMGLQRHLKVLGIFARLHYRDGKSGYLGDLPRVLDYTLAVCERYGELAGFGEWLERQVARSGVAMDRPRVS